MRRKVSVTFRAGRLIAYPILRSALRPTSSPAKSHASALSTPPPSRCKKCLRPSLRRGRNRPRSKSDARPISCRIRALGFPALPPELPPAPTNSCICRQFIVEARGFEPPTARPPAGPDRVSYGLCRMVAWRWVRSVRSDHAALEPRIEPRLAAAMSGAQAFDQRLCTAPRASAAHAKRPSYVLSRIEAKGARRWMASDGLASYMDVRSPCRPVPGHWLSRHDRRVTLSCLVASSAYRPLESEREEGCPADESPRRLRAPLSRLVLPRGS